MFYFIYSNVPILVNVDNGFSTNRTNPGVAEVVKSTKNAEAVMTIWMLVYNTGVRSPRLAHITVVYR